MDNYTWRILLIDDDRDDHFLVREMLAEARRGKFLLEWVSTFQKAQEALKTDVYDAVLVDYDMGARKGTELIREAVAAGYPSPLILLTGRGSYEVDLEAMESGAADYLNKNEVNAAFLERSIRYAIEQRRSQQSLAEAKAGLELRNQQFAGVFNHAPAGLVLFEAEEPFRVVMNNKIYQQFFPEPYCSQGMAGMGLTEYVPTAEVDGILAIFREVAHTGVARTIYDFPFSGMPGGATWWNWHLNPIFDGKRVVGLVHMAINVTEQHLAKEALEASEAHYRLLFETMLQGVVYQDQTGKITAMNPAAEKILGKTQEIFLGSTSVDEENDTIREDGSPFPGDEHPAMLALRTGQEVRGVVMGVYNPLERRHRWIRISAVPQFRPGEAAPFQVYTIFDDITEQRRMEARSAEYANQMEVQQRLLEQREMERLELARDLHDGPLQEMTAITFGLAEAIGADSEPERLARLKALQQIVAQQSHELRQFCNELRPPTLAPFGLEKAIRSHLETYQQRRPELKIHAHLAPDRKLLPENTRMALFRIYQEVMNNIAKHAQAQQVWVTLMVDQAEVALEIEDNGVGFEVPRNWVTQARSGHLGLIGIRERAAAINARVTFDSAPGKGTRVRVMVKV